MNDRKKIKDQYWPILTMAGIFVYIVLYFTAAIMYPGGSNFNKHQVGFNIFTNYWCELLGENSKNGKLNIARPFGLIAMSVLSISLSIFWIKIPYMLTLKNWMSSILQISGVSAMLCSSFIFTHFHDLFILLAVIFGIIAFSFSIYGLYLNKATSFFRLGISCIFLILLNNFIYIFDFMINYLPIIQKFTFAFVFIWISFLSFHFFKEQKIKESQLK